MNKKQLANGEVSVWQDQDETVIHHANGLTIALNRSEAVALLKWLHHMNNVWLDQDELDRMEAIQQQRIWARRGE